MSRRRNFVLFELNEVPMRVVEHYAQRHPGSAFAKVLAQGRRWVTITPDTGHLSPWITWPTLHRGVPGNRHQLVALGQDHEDADREYPPVWAQLAAVGRKVGLFGSLHSYPLPEKLDFYDFYVPDTFAAGPEAHPASLSAFQSFNLHMVDRSGRNVSSELPLKEAVGFLAKTLPEGIRPATLAKIARQLASERIWRHRTARRRTIQSLLAFDLFVAQLQLKKPEAAFFFTNHVASSMHRYWPATFTDDYSETRWADDWVRRFSGEIDYAMGEADEMLCELLAFVDRNPDYVILVAGSMGQAAVDDPNKQVRSQVLLRDMQRFLSALEVEGGWERRRTMEPTYTIAFDQEECAEAFMNAAARLKVAGKAIDHRRLEPRSVEFVLGQYNVPDEELTVTVGNRPFEPEEAGIANIPIVDEVAAAAYHVPEGMLVAYDPQGRGSGLAAQPVSTTSIAPTLLAMQGVERPAYMDRPIGELLELQLEPT